MHDDDGKNVSNVNNLHVSTSHDMCKQGIDQQVPTANRVHVKLRILSPEICKDSL